MADNVAQIIVRMDIDKPANNRVIKATKGAYNALSDLKDQVGALDSAIKRSEALEHFGKRSDRVRNMIDNFKDSVVDLKKDIKAADNYLEGAKGFETYRQRIKDAYEETALLRDVGTRARALGSGLSGVGIDILGDSAGGAGQLLQVAESFGRVKAEMPALIDQLSTQGKLTKSLADQLIYLNPGISQTTAQTAVAVGSFGVMAASIAAVAIAFKAAKDIIDDSGKAVRDFVDVNKRYAEVIATGTTDEVQAAIKANEDRNRQLELEREKLAEFVRRADDVDGAYGRLLNLNDALGLNLGGIEDVKDRLKEVDTELGNNADLNNALTTALQNGATAIADMKAAEEELMNARREASKEALGDIDRRVNFASDLRGLIKSGSVEEVTRELDRLTAARDKEQARLEQISAELLSGNITMEHSVIASAAARKEIEVLNGQISDLTLFALPAAEANDKLAEKLDKLKESAEEAAKREEELIKARTSAESKLRLDAINKRAQINERSASLEADYLEQQAQTREERQIEELRDAEDFARKRSQSLADHYRDLAQLDADYAQDRQSIIDDLRESEADIRDEQLDTIEENNKEVQKAAQDHQRNISRIQRDGQRDLAEAAAHLDAEGVQRAKQRTKDQLDDAKEQYDEEQKQRAENFKDRLEEIEKEADERKKAAAEQLRDLQRQHQQERAERQREFYEEQRRAHEEFMIKVRRQQEDWRNEDRLTEQHYQDQQTALQDSMTELERITKAGMRRVELEFSRGINGLQSLSSTRTQLTDSNAGVTYSTTPTAGTITRIKSFAGGGVPPVGQSVIVGENGPELARFMVPTRIYPGGSVGSAGGASINVNNVFNDVGSHSIAQLEGMVDRVMARTLTKAVG